MMPKTGFFPRFAIGGAVVIALATAACNGDKKEARCGYCGMKIAPDSAWRAEVRRPDGKTDSFDTPRCAFGAVQKGDEPKGSVVRVQEFYDRSWQDAANISFAVGSDVTGPMGADLVPLLTGHADKFAHDHAATKIVPGTSVDAATIAELR